MLNIINSALSSSQYIPHGHCYLWQTPLVALHVVSNALIAIAYFSIPALLIYFVNKRKDIPFSGIFMLFGAFIILCGAGHLFDIWTLWHPDYWLAGLEHATTALVSCITALQMVTLLPQFLALKTPEQLEAINRELQQEILERQRTEAERNRAYEEMEFRVQERTADLKQANTALRESEARFQRLAANVPGMLYQYQQAPDGSTSLIYASDACREIYELEPEAMATGYFEAIYADDRQPRQLLLHQSARELQGFAHEWRIVVPSGAVKWIQTISKPRREADGSTIWDGIQMDVSDRKRTEDERQRIQIERQQVEAKLQKERECLKAILDSLSDGIVACDEDRQLMLFNNATREFHGLPEAALPAEQWTEYFDLYLGDGITPMPMHEIPLFRAFEGEIVHESEMVIAPKQGKLRTLLASGRAFFDAAGNKLGAVVAMHDISERKQAESALQEALRETKYQSRLLRTVLDSTQDWIFAKDKDFRYILVNRSYADAINQSIESILGKDDLELGFSKELVFGNPAAGIRGFRTDDQAALMGKVIHNPYDPATVADGSTRILDTSKTPLYDSDETIFAVLGSSRDITDRHNAEKALRRSEAELKEKAEELEQTLRTLRLTQMQMIQAEKMSGLGQLVAGIAHEINNPVNFIHGNITPTGEYTQDLLHLLELYQAQVPQPTPEIHTFIENIDLEFLKQDLPKLLDSMKMGTQRIREIVLSLRNFSRLDEAEIKAVDLHEGIDNTLTILGNRLNAKAGQPDIQIVRQYGDLPLVECYAGQLNQVFMNILNNAIEALEQPSCFANNVGGSSQLSGANEWQNKSSHASCLPLHRPSILIRTQVVASHQVQICIADNGLGMSAEVQQKVFDPFFTTKPIGKGTGMGLAICYQIVEQHQGSIEVSSVPGQGTEVHVTLPRYLIPPDSIEMLES
ncbi:PAS domain S-box protein [Oculatella sp. LEGE 06141]|uniref:PAS domain-containing sensor histidine kinase n=1 Tax=Oculatella sp. LEGE 06141 TaxID=1828648 RepID=UPI0018830AA4|nr:PAS domain S-box protein [Oculatella sp. LEGE 06141]MBE9179442.1 PAS domain S-box protein [Oculatella sp. LEGE 06141]